MNKFLLSLILMFLSGNFLAQSQQESLEMLLEKLNKLEDEIANLSNNLDQNTYELQRIEDANQLRYMDLDKRIHQLETLILLSNEDDNQDQIASGDIDENPLSDLIANDESEEEFLLWSNSLKLIDSSNSIRSWLFFSLTLIQEKYFIVIFKYALDPLLHNCILITK